MNRQSLTAPSAVLVALLSLAAATGVRAQVLQQVPSDALIVIKITNLKSVSDKVAKFAGALGLAEVVPQLADPLGSMQAEMKLNEGFDTAGEAAIVFTKDAFEASSPDEAMLILLPVSDYKALVGSFENAKTEGPLTMFNPGGKDLVAANWGKYAVVTQNKALLSQKPAGLKLSGLAAKESKEKDAFVFLNIPMISEKALPEIEKARAQMMGEIDRELGQDEKAKEFAGVAKAAFGQALKISEGFLRDATGASFSLHLSDQGIAATAMSEFKPEGYAGKMTKQVKNSEQPLLNGLPARKYFAVGGMVNEPTITSQLIGDALDPISKELAATESGKDFGSAIDAVKRFFGATKTITFGYPMPTGALGADSILQNVMIVKGDAKVIAESQKKALDGMAGMMKLLPKESGAEMKYEMTPGGKTVGNVKLDTYAFNMTMDENNPQAAQVQQMMAFVYGPGGMSGTFGALNKDTFVVVQGGTDKLLQEVVKSAQTPQDSISPMAQVKMVSGHLPAQHVAVEYIFLDNMITAGVKYAQGFGMPVKMQLPPNLPPIGVSAATEGTALRFDGFIPTELIQAVVAAGMQTFMEMQGGGEGPPAGEGL